MEQYGRYECVTKDVGYSKCHAFVVLNKQMLLIVLNYVVRFFNLFKCHAYSPSSCRIQLNYFRDVVQLYSNNNCFCHKRIGLSKGKSLLSKKKKAIVNLEKVKSLSQTILFIIYLTDYFNNNKPRENERPAI